MRAARPCATIEGFFCERENPAARTSPYIQGYPYRKQLSFHTHTHTWLTACCCCCKSCVGSSLSLSLYDPPSSEAVFQGRSPDPRELFFLLQTRAKPWMLNAGGEIVSQADRGSDDDEGYLLSGRHGNKQLRLIRPLYGALCSAVEAASPYHRWKEEYEKNNS